MNFSTNIALIGANLETDFWGNQGGKLKKLIAIFCFVALLLSTSSFTYFYWLQEKIHESERFAQIEAGEGLDHIDHQTTISLILKEKGILPEGYEWEETGREFSFKGKFYDIVSLEQTNDGWKLTAASDEVETVLVANQSKAQQLDKDVNNSKQSHKLKFLLVKLVYDAPASINSETFYYLNNKCFIGLYNKQLTLPAIELITPPPEAV